jgi:hypothetical protein
VQQRRNPDRAIGRAGIEHMVDHVHHQRRFARGTRHQPIAMAMRQHQRGKDMPVTGAHAVDIALIEPISLQALVKKGFIGIQMARIGGVHNLQLAQRIAQTGGFHAAAGISLFANNKRLAQARTADS